MPHGYGYSSGPGFTNDPRYEYSFADRLAEFLLGMSALSGQTAGVLRQQDLDAEAQQAKQFNLFQSLAKLQQEQQTQQGTVAALKRLAPGQVGTMPDNEVAGLTKLSPEILKGFLFPQADKAAKRNVVNVGGRLVEIPDQGAPTEIYAPPPEPAKAAKRNVVNVNGRLVEIPDQGAPTEIYTPPPGADKPAKPFFEGKTSTELRLIANDPSTPPEQKALVRATLTEMEQAENAARKAGATTVTFSPGERKEDAERGAHLDMAAEIKEIAGRRPDLFGGAFGAKGRWQAFKTKMDQGDPDFPRLQALSSKLRGELVNALTGANIGPADRDVYMGSIPNIGENSTQEFWSNLEVTINHIENLRRRSRDSLRPPGSAGDASPKRGHSAPGWSVAP